MKINITAFLLYFGGQIKSSYHFHFMTTLHYHVASLGKLGYAAWQTKSSGWLRGLPFRCRNLDGQ